MMPLVLIPMLHRATHRVGLFLQARLPGVTQGEAHLLAHLHECRGGDATVGELHRAWAHKRSTLTDMLDRLECRGLVRRAVLPTDRRSVLVRLTAAGRRQAAAVHRALSSLERGVLAAASGGRTLAGFTAVAPALAEQGGAPAPRAGRARHGRQAQ